MSIIWCGGEDLDFPNGAVPAVDTNNNNHRVAYSRFALICSAPSDILKSVTFTPVTSAWMTAQWLTSAYAGNHGSIGFGSSTANSAIYAKTANGEIYNLYKRVNGADTLLASSINTHSSTLEKIDIQLGNYGATSTINVFVNGYAIITFTGNSSIAGVSNFNQVWVCRGGIYGNVYGSEVIVADEDTRPFLGLSTMAPNAAGSTNTWSNNAYTIVNPTTFNDANAEYVNTLNADAQHNVSDEPAAGIFQVRAIKIAARAMHTTDSTATQIALGVNSGGNIAVGNITPLTTAFSTVEQMFQTNPVTGNSWGDVNEINALQVNLRSA